MSSPTAFPPPPEGEEKMDRTSIVDGSPIEKTSSINPEKKPVPSSSTPPSIIIADKKRDKPEQAEVESQYLSGINLVLVMVGLSLAALLVGLDNAIIATAIPTITTVFNALEDVGWYGSAFLITACALQPIAGKFFTYFDLKWAYLSFLLGFEFGSLICATAVNSTMLIIGRAIAGCGAAGLFSGALVIIGNYVVLRQRPIWTGMLVAMFGVSSVAGPLLGAAFTERVSWRWCFYINLPIGGITAVVLTFFFNVPPRPLTKMPFKEKVAHLDLPGLLLFVPAVVMFLIAVQWGGHGYAWNSATIIGLLVGSGVAAVLFCIWQARQQNEGSVPPRIFLQRSVWAGSAISCFGLGTTSLVAYYLPLWFQTVLGDTPIQSGVRFLPCVVANVVMSFGSGGLVTQFGYFNPWLFLGSVILAVSSGLMTTWEHDEGSPMIIGILILVGVSAPCVLQMPAVGLMTIMPEVDLPVTTSILVFLQFLGGAIFLAIAENIFVSRLKDGLAQYAPELDAASVVAAGAVGLHKVVAEADLPKAILAYNDAIMGVFYLGIAGGVLAFGFSFGMKWASVKDKQVTSSV